MVHGSHLEGEVVATALPLRRTSAPPVVVPRGGHLERAAHRAHTEARLLRIDELVPRSHELSLAKKAVAFFRMSRSWVTRLSSRRRRTNSSLSLVVRASGLPPRSSTSACLTQALTAVSVRSRRRQISPMLSLPVWQRRTTSALNSGINFRLARRFLFFGFDRDMGHSLRIVARSGVSVKQGEAQLHPRTLCAAS